MGKRLRQAFRHDSLPHPNCADQFLQAITLRVELMRSPECSGGTQRFTLLR
jgi:hypothetical protein